MIRALLALVVWAVMLYGAFLLGQVAAKRKYADRRDPLPVIKAVRHALVAENMDAVTRQLSMRDLELALDEWDLKHQ